MKRRTVPLNVENLMKDVLERQQVADDEIKRELFHAEVQPLPSSGRLMVITSRTQRVLRLPSSKYY
jgi:hypothetical protein